MMFDYAVLLFVDVTVTHFILVVVEHWHLPNDRSVLLVGGLIETLLVKILRFQT
jgi:hypothetical protein